jgi:microcin C transport system ATP-binding protein
MNAIDPRSVALAPLLRVQNLHVAFGGQTVLHDLSFDLHRGQKLAIVGESGSGKTVAALALLGLLEGAQVAGSAQSLPQALPHLPDANRSAQAAELAVELMGAPPSVLQNVRGRRIAMVFQEPMSALNPLLTIGQQITETLGLHHALGQAEAAKQAIDLLAQAALTQPAAKYAAYPHQLSGGERQRAMIAMALAGRPDILIADEPTTALDVAVRQQIMALLDRLQAQTGMAVVLITHDLGVVKRFADHTLVLEKGHCVEQGRTEPLLQAPQHPYTQRLVDSVPVRRRQQTPSNGDAITPIVLQAQQLGVDYATRLPGIKGWFQKGRFSAVQGVSFQVQAGKTLGIIGESGSGKSSLALACLGLIPYTGQVTVFDQHWQTKAKHNLALRKKVQVVFQDPFSSLSPRLTVGEIVGEGLQVHQAHLTAAQRQERVLQELQAVGLTEHQYPGLLQRYPHQFSGGQRQRIAIARALIVQPALVILDEPTSALDLTIQGQVLELLQQLQAERGLAYLLITHDMAVVQAMAHDLLVLKNGQVVEQGPIEVLQTRAQHPYTRELLGADG